MSLLNKYIYYVTHSAANMLLRGTTLASKFALVVYLAKILVPDQLGVYGIFTATISYALYLCGLDFYTYSQREMMSLPRVKWGKIVYNQFAFYGVLYLVIMPILLLIFAFGLLPWKVIGWFYLILILEHLSQELYRLLVVCEKITLAHVALFFRGGAWVFVVISIYRLKPELHGLTIIWAGWSIGVAISIIIGVVSLRCTIGPIFESCNIDWSWIRRGLKVAVQFLLGTLALRGLFTFDRYFLDLYAGKTAVGVYSFFISISNSLLAFVDAGVISKQYPRIVTAYRTNKIAEYRMHLRKLAIGIVLLFVIFSFGMVTLIQPVLNYIGRIEYFKYVTTLWVLLASIGVYCLGMVPHYALYARCADRAIAVASISSLVIFLCSAIYITPRVGLTGMAISVFVGVGSLGILKAAFSWRYSYERQ